MIDAIGTTLLTYLLYRLVKSLYKKYPVLKFHPLILVPLLIILIIQFLDIPVEDYERNANALTHMLAPATIAFAIPVYKYLAKVKRKLRPILVGIVVGSITAITSTALLGLYFIIDQHLLISLLPRSITTPFAIEMSNEIGGVSALTIAFVILTGMIGALIAPLIFQALKIKDPVARGLALGMAAHAVGTNRALEYGEEEATYSTLAMLFAGVFNIIFSLTILPYFIEFIF